MLLNLRIVLQANTLICKKKIIRYNNVFNSRINGKLGISNLSMCILIDNLKININLYSTYSIMFSIHYCWNTGAFKNLIVTCNIFLNVVNLNQINFWIRSYTMVIGYSRFHFNTEKKFYWRKCFIRMILNSLKCTYD